MDRASILQIIIVAVSALIVLPLIWRQHRKRRGMQRKRYWPKDGDGGGAGFTIVIALLLASPAQADEPVNTHACRQLYAWQERCRLGPCNVKEIETWRDRCEHASAEKPKPPPVDEE